MSKHRGQSSWWWFWPLTAALGAVETVLIVCAVLNTRGLL